MRPVAGNYSNVEASIGSITRWTSSSIRGIKGCNSSSRDEQRLYHESSNSSGIKDSNSSSREYEQRLARRKMETQGPPVQHSYALFFSSRF